MIQTKVFPLSYDVRNNGSNDYTQSKQFEYDRQKPTLPSINHLINSSPLRDSPDEARWNIPRTPHNGTPLQSPPSSTKVSPVNLPSIRNNLKGDIEQPWLQIQHLPHSQPPPFLTDPKKDISFGPSVNRGIRSNLPDSDSPTPDRQILQYRQESAYQGRRFSHLEQQYPTYQEHMIHVGGSGGPPMLQRNIPPPNHSGPLIPAMIGSTGVNANNGNSNQVYGLGIYPINQDGNIQSGVMYNGISMNDPNGNDRGDHYDPRYSNQPYPRYCGDYQSMLDISSSSYQLQPIITASKDIKRRTKTGCMTCRRRRIKCDERHPTCLNCEKSKRVCVGYDPVFRNQTDKRRRKAASWSGESNYGCAQQKFPSERIMVNFNNHGNSNNSSAGDGSPSSGQVSSTVSCINTPVTVASSAATPPSANSESSEKNRCRIKITSLLDAAVVIESQESNNNGFDRPHQPPLVPSKSKDLESCPSFINNPPTWDDICDYFSEKVAVHLDDMFNTRRFSEIASTCNRRTSISIRHGKVGSSEDLAVLETIRQIFSILHPSIYVDNLALDENAKLEELRITSSYKLMRCILQLISSDRDTEFLPVAVEDYEILLKVSTLHQFIYGGVVQRPLAQDGSQSLSSPVSPQEEVGIRIRNIPKIDENINREEVWKLLQFIGTGGSLHEADMEAMEISCQSSMNKSDSVEAISVAILLGLHYSSSNSTTCKHDSRIRLRLLELSGTGSISAFLRRLIDMTLNL